MAFITYDIVQWCLRECPAAKDLCPIFFDEEVEYVASENQGKRIVTIQPTGVSVLGDSEWEIVEEISDVKID